MSEEQIEKPQASLEIYIRYREYFSAEQLASIFYSLDDLYNSLYPAFDQEAAFPLPVESRLLINKCDTGNSFLIELVEGIRQVWSIGGPTLQVTSGLGITLVMAGLVTSFAKGLAEFRKTWYEGTKAKLESEKLKRGSTNERPESDPIEPVFTDDVKTRATQAIFNFYNVIQYAPNIELVQVNGQTIFSSDDSQNRG